MTKSGTSFVVLACLVALAGCQHPANLATSDRYPSDLPPSLAQLQDILPAGRDVCQKLGLDPNVPGRCNGDAVLAISGRQTDRSLWFRKTSTGPFPGTCPRPIEFSRYKGGRQLTTILCGQPLDDALVGEDDLATLRSTVRRLNATQHKTLAQHIAAVELKQEIACQTGTTTADCD